MSSTAKHKKTINPAPPVHFALLLLLGMQTGDFTYRYSVSRPSSPACAACYAGDSNHRGTGNG
jgi:hypothetical protein